MIIEDIQPGKQVNDLDVKIIYDQTEPKFGGKVKSVLVANLLSEPKDGSKTAYLDLVGEQITKLKFKDTFKIVDAFAKQLNNGQIIITNMKKYEMLS